MADSNHDPVLDPAALDSLRALGGDDEPGLFLEVIELYLDDSATHVANLRSSLEANDVRLLERTAHTLKSSSANVGALGFSKLCLQLEQAVRNAQLDAAPSLVAAAEAQFARVQEALRATKA
jgi:HPt (histidine-containing phosphotransfer) domain-containing protein